MKKTITFLMLLTLTVTLVGCHKHTLGPNATCTTPQVCTECDKVVVEALGHTPQAEPTCAHDQLCGRCGTVLAEALPHTPVGAGDCIESQVCAVCDEVLIAATGHNVVDDGTCTNCAQQVVPAGSKYIKPGKGDYTDADIDGILPETQRTGHYNNDIDAYYRNAVLVCGDYGVEYFTPDPTGSGGYAAIVNDFAAKHADVNVTALIVPKCCAFESPAGYEDAGESIGSFINSTYAMMDEGIRTADAFGEMEKHAGEYMFYRTDHHWNSLGAYYASRAYCAANGIEPRELDSYESVIRGDVTGTLYMFSGNDQNLKRNPDYTVCRFPAVGYAMRCYNGGWYNGEAVRGNYRDYASAFICGDNPLTVITSDNKNGKSLMIFKESYGNVFVPYMIDYYETVVVVDIREQTDSVCALMDEYSVTDVLFINNAQAAIGFQDTLRSKCMS